MLRVGRISYLNVEPFFHAFPWPIAESLPPRALGEAVAEGRVDAGPLALADCLRLEGTVTRLPFGIVGPTRAQSVLLFSDRPMGELGGRRIGGHWRDLHLGAAPADPARVPARGPPPVLVGLEEPADAALVIGDAALRLRRGAMAPAATATTSARSGRRGPATPWCSPRGPCGWTRRPRRARDLESTLASALETGLASLPAIAARRRDLGLSEREIIDYLESFRYRIEPDDEKAVGEYRRLLALLEG